MRKTITPIFKPEDYLQHESKEECTWDPSKHDGKPCPFHDHGTVDTVETKDKVQENKNNQKELSDDDLFDYRKIKNIDEVKSLLNKINGELSNKNIDSDYKEKLQMSKNNLTETIKTYDFLVKESGFPKEELDAKLANYLDFNSPSKFNGISKPNEYMYAEKRKDTTLVKKDFSPYSKEYDKLKDFNDKFKKYVNDKYNKSEFDLDDQDSAYEHTYYNDPEVSKFNELKKIKKMYENYSNLNDEEKSDLENTENYYKYWYDENKNKKRWNDVIKLLEDASNNENLDKYYRDYYSNRLKLYKEFIKNPYDLKFRERNMDYDSHFETIVNSLYWDIPKDIESDINYFIEVSKNMKHSDILVHSFLNDYGEIYLQHESKEECTWDPSKHDGKPCPFHDHGSTETTKTETKKQEIKSSGKDLFLNTFNNFDNKIKKFNSIEDIRNYRTEVYDLLNDKLYAEMNPKIEKLNKECMDLTIKEFKEYADEEKNPEWKKYYIESIEALRKEVEQGDSEELNYYDDITGIYRAYIDNIKYAENNPELRKEINEYRNMTDDTDAIILLTQDILKDYDTYIKDKNKYLSNQYLYNYLKDSKDKYNSMKHSDILVHSLLNDYGEIYLQHESKEECTWDPSKHDGKPCPFHNHGTITDNAEYKKTELIEKKLSLASRMDDIVSKYDKNNEFFDSEGSLYDEYVNETNYNEFINYFGIKEKDAEEIKKLYEEYDNIDKSIMKINSDIMKKSSNKGK